jgi:hypothetical protein
VALDDARVSESVQKGFQVTTGAKDDITNHDTKRGIRSGGTNRHERSGIAASFKCSHR